MTIHVGEFSFLVGGDAVFPLDSLYPDNALVPNDGGVAYDQDNPQLVISGIFTSEGESDMVGVGLQEMVLTGDLASSYEMINAGTFVMGNDSPTDNIFLSGTVAPADTNIFGEVD